MANDDDDNSGKYDGLADLEEARIRREQARLDKRIEREAAEHGLPVVAQMLVRPGEWEDARLTPRCIVHEYIYADVGLLVGPGSTGKTTLLLWEAAHIILGKPLYGREISAPGPVVLISAEDPRDLVFARMREVTASMELSRTEIDKIRQNFYVWDVSFQAQRLAELDLNGNIALTWVADGVVDRFVSVKPAMVCFDPTVSFGAGERLVNDSEQAVILAARRIKNGLDCCVRYVHHTGKQSARDGTVDQYAGRGGSALPDGARMVAVMRKAKVEDTPMALMAKEGDNVFELAIPKMSYAPPQMSIWMKREGYRFDYAVDIPQDQEMAKEAEMAQVERFLLSELKEERRYSQVELEAAEIMAKSKLKVALAMLSVQGRLEARRRPGQYGKRYLHPTQAPVERGEERGEDWSALARRRADEVEQFLARELGRGIRYSRTGLERVSVMSKGRIKAAVDLLFDEGRAEYRERPEIHGRGPQKYLHVLVVDKEGNTPPI